MAGEETRLREGGCWRKADHERGLLQLPPTELASHFLPGSWLGLTFSFSFY